MSSVPKSPASGPKKPQVTIYSNDRTWVEKMTEAYPYDAEAFRVRWLFTTQVYGQASALWKVTDDKGAEQWYLFFQDLLSALTSGTAGVRNTRGLANYVDLFLEDSDNVYDILEESGWTFTEPMAKQKWWHTSDHLAPPIPVKEN